VISSRQLLIPLTTKLSLRAGEVLQHLYDDGAR
jgi:hypothetical protein